MQGQLAVYLALFSPFCCGQTRIHESHLLSEGSSSESDDWRRRGQGFFSIKRDSCISSTFTETSAKKHCYPVLEFHHWTWSENDRAWKDCSTWKHPETSVGRLCQDQGVCLSHIICPKLHCSLHTSFRYKLVILMSSIASVERRALIVALGAEVRYRFYSSVMKYIFKPKYIKAKQV